MDVGVIGAGSWGTAIARLLGQKGHRTVLWARNPDFVETLATRGENPTYLPGVSLPEALRFTADLARLSHADVQVLAVPSFAMREILQRLRETFGRSVEATTWVSLTKGLEYRAEATRLTTMSEVIGEELGSAHVLALSGPNFAVEVAQEQPTTAVLAGRDPDLAASIQTAFMTERFRVYTSADLHGVELAAATKNVIALAAGISDGLGHGDNAKGALVARGLVEMTRLGESLGAQKETFFGLAGLGDLVITCMSGKSRNHTVGERLGRGESLAEIQNDMRMVAEGVYAVRALHAFGQARGIDLPITSAVNAVLYEGADPRAKLAELMTREPKRERI